MSQTGQDFIKSRNMSVMVRRQLRSPDYYPHLANSYWVRNCANVLLPACVSLGHSVGVSGGTSTTICGVLSGIFTQQFTELHHPWELELCSHYYPDHTEAYTAGILLPEPLAQPALQALSTSRTVALTVLISICHKQRGRRAFPVLHVYGQV